MGTPPTLIHSQNYNTIPPIPTVMGENGNSSNSSTPHGVLLQNCRIGPTWPEAVCVFANLCGLTSTCIWFIVLLPQILKNWRRKSVEGLSVLWATANFTASLVNLFFVFSVNELPWYTKVNSVYMPTLELTLLIQFVIFGNFRAIVKLVYGAVCLIFWSTIITVELLVTDVCEKVQWLAITLWCIETFPQVMLNMKLHSTHGQSTVSVAISLVGKTTDFLSTYLLVMPLQYVIMAYFSSTMAYINGLQVAWYIRKPNPSNTCHSAEASQNSYRSYAEDIHQEFGEEDLEEEAEDTDAMVKSDSTISHGKHILTNFQACSRIVILIILTIVLVAYIIGLLWNTHSFVAFLAPCGILLIFGCTFAYYNWLKNVRLFWQRRAPTAT